MATAPQETSTAGKTRGLPDGATGNLTGDGEPVATRPRSQPLVYSITVGAVAVAVFLRWLLDPILADFLPLVTLFGAVAVAVAIGGYRPALFATVAGYFACDYLFISPRGGFGLADLRNIVGLIAYLVTCMIIVGFGEAMRLAQARTRERAEAFRVTLASIGDAVITADTEGRAVFLNAVAQALTGWTQEEAQGVSLERVFHIVNEETRRPVDNPVMRALREGRTVGLANHTVLLSKDGSERPIDDRAACIHDDQGRITGAVLTFHDISQRRRLEKEMHERIENLAASEEQMRSVVDHVIDGIITIDERGKVESFNAAAERLFGYRASEIIGHNVNRLMPEPYHGEHDGYLANYLRTGEAKIIGIGREVVGRRKDGSTFPMDLAVSAFHLEGRRFFTGIVRDITDRKRAEESLREADRRKDEFLAMLAHELRNPLAPIRNAVQVQYLKGAADPELQWTRDVIERQVQQLTRLVDDLMDVSRISRGKINLQLEAVDLAAVVERACETSRSFIDDRKHELEVALPSEPVRVEGDTARLAQVISNLLNNAAKYTEVGGRIRLIVEPSDGEALIRVHDTGMGIAPEMLPKLFDMFTQAQGSENRAEGGLGIGLNLVQRLVELHGGSVQAFSEGPGRGSEFRVRLPLWQQTLAPIVSERKAETPHTAPARRVLIVDDNADAAESLAVLLRILGHHVRVACDGPAALNEVRSQSPDVVLLDIGLPRMNGLEVARRMREDLGLTDAMLVALTGFGQEDDRRRSQEAGFNAHLIKPVNLEALRALLARTQSVQAPSLESVKADL
ncbi:MAG: PAS domain S-box protein [Planctomycetes bacterium]|nr:PAS domain S-box protein [Planctomycetota bacterium]